MKVSRENQRVFQLITHSENCGINTETGSELAQRRSHLPLKPILQQLDNGEKISEKYAIYYCLSAMGVLIHSLKTRKKKKRQKEVFHVFCSIMFW